MITDYIFTNAKKFPEKPAFIYNEITFTWSDLAASVDNAAHIISSKMQSDQQQIVALMLQNSQDFIVAYFGAIHAGHIAMPLDPNFKALEIETVLERMNPSLIVTNDKYKNVVPTSEKVIFVDELKAEAPKNNNSFLRMPPEEQVASMLFTSGTTGNPKAVPYTHTNHMWNIAAISKMWQWTEDDTLLLSLPLSHWHGLVMALDGTLYHGNTTYLQTWFDAEDTLSMLESGKISLFMHVPIAYSRLVAHNPEQSYDLSKVRLCVSGSSFMPPKLWHQFKDRFDHSILERYGANEMGLLTSNHLDDRQPGSVGYKLDDVSIKIMPDGEVAMKSPGLFPGYWRNEEATAKQRLSDGFWLSGDIGEFDDNGRLWLKGRVQEKMKKFGYTVYPRDVEWALMQHPDVKEVVVLSIQTQEDLSDTFVFFVVGDVTEEQIFAYAKKEMPNFWRPDKVILLDEIPKTGRTSKPAIRQLREIAESATSVEK